MRSEVIKFSAGGFRDFTRIAASDPTMWRDVFLYNKDAVLEMLGRFNEDLTALQRMIRRGDGDGLFDFSPEPAPFEWGLWLRARKPQLRISAGEDLKQTSRRRDGGADEDLWVFGYGSLMWRPGFSYAERRKATLRGWRRSLCVYSHVYRGTPEQPGLVLGLDQGGMCAGVAFRVHASLRGSTIRYLREREQVTAVYIERIELIMLETGEQRRGFNLCGG